MRRLGCFVLLVLVIAAGLYGADQWGTSYAERRTAQRLASEFEAAAEVEFRGWPVTARMIAGSIPSADITLRGLELDNGAVLDELDVALIDVEVSLATLIDQPENLPPAREGTFTARLSDDAVAALLGVPGGLVAVELTDGVVRMSAAGLEVDAEVTASDGDVAFALQGPIAQLLGAGAYTIDLSSEPGSPAVEEVQIGDGVLVVAGTLTEVAP